MADDPNNYLGSGMSESDYYAKQAYNNAKGAGAYNNPSTSGYDYAADHNTPTGQNTVDFNAGTNSATGPANATANPDGTMTQYGPGATGIYGPLDTTPVTGNNSGNGSGNGNDTSNPLAGPGPGEVTDSTILGQLSGPSNVETLYGQHGQDPFSAPSDSQMLFSEGMTGNDPYFSYAEQQANKAINDAASARGGFNSGAALQAIGNSTANLRGQQAAQLYGLAPQADSAERQRMQQGFDFAGAADTSKLNRLGAEMGVGDDWQALQQGRLTGGLSSETDLSKAKADTTSSAYQSALSIYNTDGLAGIEAALQKAGINPTGDATKDFLTLASIGVTALSGKK